MASTLHPSAIKFTHDPWSTRQASPIPPAVRTQHTQYQKSKPNPKGKIGTDLSNNLILRLGNMVLTNITI